jgi:hypothetical protein
MSFAGAASFVRLNPRSIRDRSGFGRKGSAHRRRKLRISGLPASSRSRVKDFLEIEKRSGLARAPFAREAPGVTAIRYDSIRNETANLTARRLEKVAETFKNLGVSVLVLVGAAPLPDDLGFQLGKRPFYEKNRPRTKRVGVLDNASKEDHEGGVRASA